MNMSMHIRWSYRVMSRADSLLQTRLGTTVTACRQVRAWVAAELTRDRRS